MKKVLIIALLFLISSCAFACSKQKPIFSVEMVSYSAEYSGKAITPILENNNLEITAVEFYNSVGEKIDYMVNAGNYIVKVFSDNASKSFSFNIKKKHIDFELQSKTVTYSGEPQGLSANITRASGYKLVYTYNDSESKPINAGEYIVKCKIDSANYYGEETSTLIIAKKQLTISAEKQENIYSGEQITYNSVVKGIPENCEIAYTYNNLKNAPSLPGRYVVGISLNSKNYSASCETELIISKKEMPLALSKSTFDYCEQNIDITPYIKCDVKNAIYNISCKEIKNSGKYLVTINLISDLFSGSLTKEIVVNKKQLNVTLTETTATYSSEPISYALPNDLKKYNCEITYNGKKEIPTESGEYAVCITIQEDNYAYSSNSKLTINKKSVDFSLIATNFDYSGEKIILQARENYEISYELFNADNTKMDEVINVGKYKAVVVLSEDNFKATKTFNITVSAKEIEVKNFITEYYYTGNKIELDYTLSCEIEIDIELSFGNAVVEDICEIGKYSVKLTSKNSNYSLDKSFNVVVKFSSSEDLLSYALDLVKNKNIVNQTITGTMSYVNFGLRNDYVIDGLIEKNNSIIEGEVFYDSSASYPVFYGFNFSCENSEITYSAHKTDENGNYRETINKTENINSFNNPYIFGVTNFNASDFKISETEQTENGYLLTMSLCESGEVAFNKAEQLKTSSEISLTSSEITMTITEDGKLIKVNFSTKFTINDKIASQNIVFVLY